MAAMDDFATDAPDTYPCCDHCDHDEPDYEPSQWRHEEPCPAGCDEPE